MTEEEPFDAEWYLAAYPMVRKDIARGVAKDARSHYERRGRFRGYLPDKNAPRPDSASAPRSRFGGLWTDQGNALDILDGKVELGAVTQTDAALLETFIVDGYVILERAVPGEIVESAHDDLVRAYEGGDERQRFECLALGHQFTHWIPELKQHPAKAVEIHTRSSAIRDSIFAPAISRFLGLVFERRAMASQTLGYYRGSGQGAHQDSAYVSYSLNKNFVASWVALEDAEAGAGELFYFPGSQHIPDFLYAKRYKNIFDAKRMQPGWSDAEIQSHVVSLPSAVKQIGSDERTFVPKAGDALIWAADLVHGGKPISATRTRKSVVTHYCPIDVAPLYFERKEPGARIERHGSGNYWTTFM